MKVNEIINEGPLWDKMKGVARGVQGAVQGYQTSKTNRTASEPILAAAKQVAADWAKQKAQLAAGGVQPTLANFAQFMQPRTPTVAAPTAADFANPAAYIQKSVAQHFANRSNNVTAPAVTTQASPTQPAATTLSPGFTVVSSSPIVLRYRKRDYALNDRDQWVQLPGNRPVNPTMASLLNKELGKL